MAAKETLVANMMLLDAYGRLLHNISGVVCPFLCISICFVWDRPSTKAKSGTSKVIHWLIERHLGGACGTSMLHGAVGQREDLFLDTNLIFSTVLFLIFFLSCALLSLFTFITPFPLPFDPRPSLLLFNLPCSNVSL